MRRVFYSFHYDRVYFPGSANTDADGGNGFHLTSSRREMLSHM